MAVTNKPKTTIRTAGDAFVITAGFKLETVKNLAKYGKDNALKLVDKETKDPYFAVMTGKDTQISKFGVVFTGANRDGYAECTGFFPKTSMSEEAKKEFLRDNLAFAVNHINKIQEQIEEADVELQKVIATVDEAITIQ